MNWLNTIILLLVTVLAVYWEAAFSGLRYLLGAQVDLLPALRRLCEPIWKHHDALDGCGRRRAFV